MERDYDYSRTMSKVPRHRRRRAVAGRANLHKLWLAPPLGSPRRATRCGHPPGRALHRARSQARTPGKAVTELVGAGTAPQRAAEWSRL